MLRRHPHLARPGSGPLFPGQLEHGAITVAAHAHGARSQRLDQLHGAVRLSAPGQIAAADDEVDVGLLDLGQYRFERRDIGVYVGDDRDPVDRPISGHVAFPVGGAVHFRVHAVPSCTMRAFKCPVTR